MINRIKGPRLSGFLGVLPPNQRFNAREVGDRFVALGPLAADLGALDVAEHAKAIGK